MGQILDAIAPIGGDGSFPLPNLVQSSIPGTPSYTFEGPQIDGLNMPGQWLLTKSRRIYGWQMQQASFLTGAYLLPKGDPLMEIEYDVRIWESGTMGLFRQMLQTILKKPVLALPGGVLPASAAHGIHDPILKDLGVTSVVVSFVDPPKNPLVTSGGKGPWVGKVGFFEYRPLRPALPVPDQTIPDPGAVTPSAANNLATAGAAVTAGASSLQGAAAQALVPPR